MRPTENAECTATLIPCGSDASSPSTPDEDRDTILAGAAKFAETAGFNSENWKDYMKELSGDISDADSASEQSYGPETTALDL